MNEKEKMQKEILGLIAKEIEERRKKSGLIVDRIDTEALIKIYNEILELK